MNLNTDEPFNRKTITTMSLHNDATNDEARAAILAANTNENRWMVDADVDQLRELLADEFVLIHITGQKQSKNDWLDEIDRGSMNYHDIREQTVTVIIQGSTAKLVARNLVTATIWGTKAVWPLQMVTMYTREGDSWRPVTSQATTF